MGYFLEDAGRDYMILERGADVAQFFRHKPRHRRLNSFNKRFNWFPEPEFNLRFDWNSMLTHDYSFPFREYSKELHPLADDMVRYLGDLAERYGINIQYNTGVTHVGRDPETKQFILTGSDGNEYRCRVLVMATGPVKPNIPDVPGIEHVEGYEHHDTDLSRFEGKRVIILGHGNSAFETANHLANAAAMITIITRNRWLKHAWHTHYAGDVRAAGNCILDMSQLKLLHSVQGLTPTKIEKMEDGTLRFHYLEEFPHWTTPGEARGWVVADIIIRCTGWKCLEPALFDAEVMPEPSDETGKYPRLSSCWETSVPDLYYAGTAMEGRNRRSPMCFIHGYRYGCRALFRILEERYESVVTPNEKFSLKDAADLEGLARHIIQRVSVSSGLHEAYGIMSDALGVDPERGAAELFYELPADYFREHPYFFGKKMILFTLEYGFQNFPGSDPNTFVRRNDPERPGCVAYLHPVLRFYEGGEFVKGRTIRSSSVIRYDKLADEFDGDFGHEKPFNIVRNFINEIAGVTSEIYPEEHFQNTEERGGFTPWPVDKRVENHGLPQCVLTLDSPQVTDFEHIGERKVGPGSPVPPWVHRH